MAVPEASRDLAREGSLRQYGSASLDADSPHHADQARLFARRETRPVHFELEEVMANAVANYRPGSTAASENPRP